MKRKILLFLFLILTLKIFAADVVVSGNYSDYSYYGDSTKIGRELIFTPNAPNQKGVIVSNKVFDLRKDFSFVAELYLGDRSVRKGADGAVFFFKSQDLENAHFASGQAGKLYYSDSSSGAHQTFEKSFGIKADIWDNGAGAPYNDGFDQNTETQFAFLEKGEITSLDPKNVPSLEDGAWHKITIEWIAPNSGTIGTLRYKNSQDIVVGTRQIDYQDILGGNLAYFQFNAVSGINNYNFHKIREIKVDGTIPESEFPLKIEETVTPNSYISGEVLSYSAKITNTGSEKVTNLEVSSNTGVDYSGNGWIEYPSQGKDSIFKKPNIEIPPNSSITLTGTKTANQSDVNKGTIINTTSVKGYTNHGTPTEEEYTDAVETRAKYRVLDYVLREIAYTNPSNGIISQPGGDTKYRYKFQIENIGGKDLKTITFVNTKTPSTTIQVTGNLASGATKDVTYDYVLTGSDESAPKLVNEIKVNAVAIDNSGNLDKNLKFADVVNQNPDLEGSITNTISGSPNGKIQGLGDVIDYQLTLKNLTASSVNNLEAVLIKDKDLAKLQTNDRNFSGVKASALKLVDLTNFSQNSINQNTIANKNYSYTVTQDDIDDGNVKVTVFYKAENTGGTIYTTSNHSEVEIDNAILTKSLDLAVSKTLEDSSGSLISGDKFSNVGDKIKYSFVVTNQGKRNIKNLKLIDPTDSTKEIDLGTQTLAIGASVTLSQKYTKIIDGNDLNNGQIDFDFRIEGEVGSAEKVGKTVNDITNGNITDDYNLNIIVDKGDKFTTIGSEIKYHYEIENIGNRNLGSLNLKDKLTNNRNVQLDKVSIGIGEKAISSGLSYIVKATEFNTGNLRIEGDASVLTNAGRKIVKTSRKTVEKFDFNNININMSTSSSTITYGAVIDYSIEIENIDQINDANELELKDEISKITNSNGDEIFENIQIKSISIGGVPTPPLGDINALKLTIPKNSRAVINVQATVKDQNNITLSSGETIKNEAFIEGKTNGASVDLSVISPSLVVTTDVNTENSDKIIEPGEKVIYTINIKNTTSLDSKDVLIVDRITEMKNLKNEFIFLKPLSIDKIEVIDKVSLAKIPFTYDIAKGEIKISTINSGQEAKLTIKPKVKSNISFEDEEVITNLFSVNGDNYSHVLKATKAIIEGVELSSNLVTNLSENKITLDEEVTYNVEIKNLNKNLILLNVNLETDIEDVLNQSNNKIFKNVRISKIYDKETNTEKGSQWPSTLNSGKIILPKINGSETLVVEIKAKLNEMNKFVQNEMIEIDSKVNLQGSLKSKIDRLKGNIILPELIVEKIADREKIAMGEELSYTITVTNNSEVSAKNLEIKDDILKIEGETANGLKDQVFTSWKWSVDPDHSSFKPLDNGALNITSAQGLNLGPNKSIVFVVKGITNKDIVEDSFSNTVYIKEALSQISKEATAKSLVNKEGIIISKTANKLEAKRGEFVKYTLKVFNSNDVQMKDIKIIDVLPPGFEYIKESSLLTDDDNSKVSVNPKGNRILTFDKLNGKNLEIKGKETIELSYILKVGIGVRDGKAENKAFVNSFLNQKVSNIASYSIEIIKDPLFDTGSIIGKVFNDIDEDGYQDDALAKNIKIIIETPNNSRVNLYKNKSKRKITPKFVLKELKPGEKVIVDFKNDTKKLSKITLSTKAGTYITLDSLNKKKIKNKGLKRRGLTGEKIVLKRVKLKNGIEKIEIENKGKTEEGIPGARLMTIDGLIIETDSYGRFHIPVLKGRKTNNYLIKLDLESLPGGTYITTENPKVMRTTKTISKFNFGVVIPNDHLSGKRGDN